MTFPRLARLARGLLVFGISVLLLVAYMSTENFKQPPPEGDKVPRLIPPTHYQPQNLHHEAGHAQKAVVEEDADQWDQSLQIRERHHLDFNLAGYTFDEAGVKEKITGDVTSCLAHSFTPYIEREAAKRFLDPPHDQAYFANSPALRWFHGELVLVSRIWLDREKYEKKKDWPPNQFADNWLYTQKFDRYMRPISNGSIVGIPSPKQWWVGDGPIEPRLCSVKDRLFITFNAAMAYKHKRFMDFTVMWDYEQNLAIIPEIKGGSPMMNLSSDMPRDKHWMALVQDGELYFVHNLDPLRIMHCTLSGYCEFVHEEKDEEGFVFKHSISHLRGGTTFELYQWPYYLGLAHTTLYKSGNKHRFYTANLVVLSVQPYRIVYVSNDIEINSEIFKLAPMVRPMYIDDGFIFPVSLILETKDSLAIGVHVNDHSSVVLRLRGVQAVMEKVIASDEKHTPRNGPPIGFLHKHIHDVMEDTKHQHFLHRE